MKLGHYWRIHVYNGATQLINVTVQSRRWKFVNGVLTYSTEAQVFSANVISLGYGSGASQNNSSDLYLGSDFEVEITPGGTMSGSVLVLLQLSTDGGTTWPSTGEGEVLCGHVFSSSSTGVTKQARI